MRPPRRLVVSVGLFVLAVGLAGYGAMGNPAGWRDEPGMVESQSAAKPDAAQARALITDLNERLKVEPDDAEAWTLLGRVQASLEHPAEAVAAFKRVAELQPRNAQALADYADSLGTVQQGSLAGEPERLVMQAVRLDPNNSKALTLAGTIAFSRNRYPEAIVFWERALRGAEPDAAHAQALRGAIAEARRRGGPASDVAPAGKPASGRSLR
ncbi:tetratricopeptide repeat protein [Rubrivivax sp. A210]|uniref:tetratricopeptide repeat protein n=1 Tax=Rubrivivax sp. A210 TaxID=2772301 RepID=UPI0019185520|nr:tetratricopeptide repeat protein [Rubrivivax sp. A210]